MIGTVQKIIFYSLLIGIWVAVSNAAIWPDYIFPTPWGVWAAFKLSIRDGSLWFETAYSLRRIFLGYGLSFVGGTLLGIFLGRMLWLENTLGSLVTALQALPSICWYPAAILWFGLTEGAILFVVVMGAILAITISTMDGIKNIPPLYLKAAGTLGIKGFRLYTKILLPAILPNIVTGMKLGWSFAWRALLGAELLLTSMGLGHMMHVGQELNDINQIVAVMLMIIAIGLMFDRTVLAYLERWVRIRWGLIQRN